ncbi:MAG: sugar phosphate isomerase/epimerase family protein [Bryobacterales bacterium]
MQRRDFFKAIPAAAAAMSASAAPPKTAGGRSPRLRTAICAYSFRNALGAGTLRYEDLVDMAVKNDVDGLDLTVYWFPKEDLDGFLSGLRLKAYMNAVEIPSIAIRSDLCKKSERDQDQESAWLMHWVDVADRLGASFIRVFGGTVPKGATEDEAAGWVAEILKRTADYAGSKGVILGLENHGGITMQADRIHSILDKVNHPYVRMNLDTGNFNTRPYEQIQQSVPYAANSQFKVHITNDGKQEDSDWNRIVKMLADGGYRGYMALEYEAKEDPFVAVPRYLSTLNELKKKYNA